MQIDFEGIAKIKDDVFSETIKNVVGDAALDTERGRFISSAYFKGKSADQLDQEFLAVGGICVKSELQLKVEICMVGREMEWGSAVGSPNKRGKFKAVLVYKFYYAGELTSKSKWIYI